MIGGLRVLGTLAMAAGVLATNVTQCGTPQSEIDALHAVYNATRGEGWLWTGVPWNFSQPEPAPCAQTWEGVMCESYCNATACVDEIVGIYLDNNNMVGTLPPELVYLPMLKYFFIYNNYHLAGPLPISIGNLTQLQTVHLVSTGLDGDLPSSMGALHQLRDLQLYDNLMTGSVPDALCEMCELELLYISNTLLAGTIPSCLGHLPLQYLVLAYSQLTGPIPPSLGNLTSLASVFSLNNNLLNSYIPPELGNLTGATFFGVYNNLLTGSLPSELGQLTKLQQLSVMNNELSGRISQAVTSSPELLRLDCGYNHFTGPLPLPEASSASLLQYSMAWNRFTGTLPARLGEMPALVTLDVYANRLNGTIPASLGGLGQLELLDLYGNELSGTIPAALANLTRLTTLYLSANLLHGTIPAALFSLSALTSLYMDTNALSGVLPAILGEEQQLVFFSAGNNLLSGSVPAGVARWPLQAFVVLENLFTGTLPAAAAANWTGLKEMNLFFNFFEGTFPFSLDAFPSMVMFQIQSNLLEGDLAFLPPAANSIYIVNVSTNLFVGPIGGIQGLDAALAVDVSNNALTGTVGAWNPAVQVLSLHDNLLHGPIDALLNASVHTPLVDLDLGSNRFSGLLPLELAAELPVLSALSLVRNCFSGSLSAALCEAPALTVVALDGLSTASACRRPTLPGLRFVSSYIVSRDAVGGTVPECLLSMASMQSLHLAGNSLTGTLSAEGALGGNLTDLSLSHNLLSGPVPKRLQGGARWANLDLSFNKFSGSLSDEADAFAPGASVSLDNNRLSGRIPAIYDSVVRLNLLQGNIFSCSSGDRVAPTGDLPPGDPQSTQYDCGSDTLNLALIAYSCACLVSAGAAGVAVQRVGWVPRRFPEWNAFVVKCASAWRHVYGATAAVGAAQAADTLGPRPSAHAMGQLFTAVRRVAIALALFLASVTSPVYVGLSAQFGSYAHQYAWADSAGLLTGQNAALGLIGIVLATAVLAYALQLRAVRRLQVDLGEVVRRAPEWRRAPGSALAASVLALGNVVVVLLANGYFVFLSFGVSRGAVVGLSIALSMFKLLWGALLLRGMVWFLQGHTASVPVSAPWRVRLRAFAAGNALRLEFVGLYSSLLLFNNIAAPCLAVLFASPSCFYYVFAAPAPVTSIYSYAVCRAFNAASCVVYEPSVHTVTFQPPFNYSYQCSSALLLDYAYVFVCRDFIVGVVIPIALVLLSFRAEVQAEGGRQASSATISADNETGEVELASRGSSHTTSISDALPRLWRTLAPSTPLPAGATVFPASDYAARIATMLATMLTFGTALPYLAVISALAICSSTTLTQLGVARYLSVATLAAESEVEDLSLQCGNMLSSLALAVRPVSVLMVLFMGSFVFDAQGDVKGPNSALGAMMALWSLPAIAWGAETIWAALVARSLPLEKAIEMRPSGHWTTNPVLAECATDAPGADVLVSERVAPCGLASIL